MGKFGAPEKRSLPDRSTITIVLRAASVAYRAYELDQQVRSVPQFVPHQGQPAPCRIIWTSPAADWVQYASTTAGGRDWWSRA